MTGKKRTKDDWHEYRDDEEIPREDVINRIERTPEEKRKLYHIDMKEPRGEPPGLTYFWQIGAALKRWWQQRE